MDPVVKRIYILSAILAAGFSLVFALPDGESLKSSRLHRYLPERVTDWGGEKVQPGERELDILAKDTEFERRSYVHDYDQSLMPLEVSLVFSGKDLNNSIHRPERCLVAQGWAIEDEKFLLLKGVLPDGGDLPVKKILCHRLLFDEENQPMLGPDGKQIYMQRVQYYTFFGHEKIVSGHYERTFEDIRARLLAGYDQRWAYATFATNVSKTFVDQGVWPSSRRVLSVEQTERLLQDFIKELMPMVLDKTAETH